jgi:hypothetical protein
MREKIAPGPASVPNVDSARPESDVGKDNTKPNENDTPQAQEKDRASKANKGAIPSNNPWLRQEGLEDKNLYANVVKWLLNREFWNYLYEQLESKDNSSAKYMPSNTVSIIKNLPSNRRLLSLTAEELVMIVETLPRSGIKLSELQFNQRGKSKGAVVSFNLTYSDEVTFRFTLDESISERGRIQIEKIVENAGKSSPKEAADVDDQTDTNIQTEPPAVQQPTPESNSTKPKHFVHIDPNSPEDRVLRLELGLRSAQERVAGLPIQVSLQERFGEIEAKATVVANRLNDLQAKLSELQQRWNEMFPKPANSIDGSNPQPSTQTR